MISLMFSVLSFIFVSVTVVLALPIAVFFIEIVASCVLLQRNWMMPPSGDRRLRCAVLVPAHNESTGLLPTLTDIRAQLRAADRLLVIADNCTDDTASIATTASAIVVVRNEPGRKGKGYALAFGLYHLREDPPDIVIVIDADCRVADGAIDRLIAACEVTRRPVQGLFQMIAHDESPITFRVAEFAWRVKNWLRPLGLQKLGLPCQLMGSGMAFPWSMIQSAQVATGSIVEDLKLGIDLALTGNAPVFCAFRTVTSALPFSVKGAQTQRLRWEGVTSV